MSYRRLIARNGLEGGYDGTCPEDQADRWNHVPVLQWGWMYNPVRPRDPNRSQQVGLSFLAGDMRRMENDQRDPFQLGKYAERAGVTPDQAKAVLDAFFQDDW